MPVPETIQHLGRALWEYSETGTGQDLDRAWLRDLPEFQRVEIGSRPVLVIAGDPGDPGEAGGLRALDFYLREQRPVVILAGAVASVPGPGIPRPDVVILPPGHVTHEHPRGPEILVWNSRATGIEAADLGLLLAWRDGAESILVSGWSPALIPLIRANAPISTVQAVASTYPGRVRDWHLMLILMAAMVALFLAVATTPVGNAWWDQIWNSWKDLFQ